MAELAGKTALITGALGTIGQALLSRFSEEGARIVALDRPEAPDAGGRTPPWASAGGGPWGGM